MFRVDKTEVRLLCEHLGIEVTRIGIERLNLFNRALRIRILETLQHSLSRISRVITGAARFVRLFQRTFIDRIDESAVVVDQMGLQRSSQMGTDLQISIVPELADASLQKQKRLPVFRIGLRRYCIE